MDNLLPNIFKQPIVNNASDYLWDDAAFSHLLPRETLIVSLSYAANSSEETLLLKMLAACGLNPEKYNLLQIEATQCLSWQLIRNVTKAKNVLLFGVAPAQLGVSALMIPHQLNNFNNAVWMPTFSLDQIGTNDALKKHLWTNAFKKLYF